MRIFFHFIASFVFISSSAQKKLALIVSVGTYMPGSKIPPIASINDIKYIKAVLKNNGFTANHIDTLKNAKATKAAILKGLDALAIKAGKGDVVLVHFSMHGQQIRDQRDAGKDEDDGWDEALLPYDVKKPQYYPGVYTGENHLRDDDLAPKLNAIRNKLGSEGSLLVLIDACHSGTATRASEFAISRGEPVPFLDPENPIENTVNLPLKDNFLDALSDSASNMVVISGSGPHQQNFQTEVTISNRKEQVGSLSYGFYKAMNALEKDSDYEVLFQKIKAFIQAQHPAQVPLIEGNTSQIVFSGRYHSKKEIIYLTLANNHLNSDSVFKIDKGMMDGIGEGTRIKIYAPGTNNLMTEGVIQKAEHFVAYGTSAKSLNKGVVYEARLETMNYGLFSTSIKIKNNSGNSSSSLIEKQLKEMLKPFKYISFGDHSDMMIDLDSATDGVHHLQLVDATDSVRWNKDLQQGNSLNETDLNELAASIKNAIRIKYLRSLPDGGELGAFIRAEIITEKTNDAQGELTLAMEENFSLKIVNNSNVKLFYTVIDITPDNKVSILYPTKSREPADYLIQKKSEVIRKLGVSKNTPSGKEFMKIILSKEPLDLRSVLEHRKQRAEMTSFQMALDDLFGETSNETNTRTISGIKAEEIGIITVSFTVKGK